MSVFSPTKTARSLSEINVIPMIDVLLVLLIIFMLAAAIRMASILQLPPETAAGPVDKPAQAIVLELPDTGGFAINGVAVPGDSLRLRLSQLYAGRVNKTIFVATGRRRSYADLIDAADRARDAGVQVIGVMPSHSRR